MSEAAVARARAWIATPLFDGILFIGIPVLSLFVGWAVSLTPAQSTSYFLFDKELTLHVLLLRTVIHSHLVITVFRSHANREIFRQHKLRFTVVPAVVFLIGLFSPFGLMTLLLVTTLWDLYHSSLQTFGIGRIYDAKYGADPEEGRFLDILVSHGLYLAPFLVGPLFIPILEFGNQFPVIGLRFLDGPIAWLKGWQWAIGQGVVVACVVVGVIYAVHLARRYRAGRPVSPQKLALFATTGVTCWLAWGMNSFGEALLIVNLFHAVQYFAIVFWVEKRTLTELFGFAQLKHGALFALAALLVLGLGYGFIFGATSEGWSRVNVTTQRVMLSLINVVALMHFWYDGFIWSVRRKEV